MPPTGNIQLWELKRISFFLSSFTPCWHVDDTCHSHLSQPHLGQKSQFTGCNCREITDNKHTGTEKRVKGSEQKREKERERESHGPRGSALGKCLQKSMRLSLFIFSALNSHLGRCHFPQSLPFSCPTSWLLQNGVTHLHFRFCFLFH